MTRFKLSSRYLLAALALGVLGLLAGCDKDKDIEPPAELVDFKSSLDVDRVWSVSIGGGDPVMRAGLAPAVDGEVVYAAGREGDVLAISQANGKTLWRARTRSELTGGPGAGFGIVAVGSANGELITLDQATGTTLWTVSVGGEVLSAPAIAPDAVIVRTVAGVLLGLSREEGVNETEDHFACVCEVMRYLIAGDDVEVANLTQQQKFFSTHLQPWGMALCDAIEQHPQARFYAALAGFVRAFLSVEAQGFDMLA